MTNHLKVEIDGIVSLGDGEGVNRSSGRRLHVLCSVRLECFPEGTGPTEYTKKPNTLTEPGEFFKSDM